MTTVEREGRRVLKGIRFLCLCLISSLGMLGCSGSERAQKEVQSPSSASDDVLDAVSVTSALSLSRPRHQFRRGGGSRERGSNVYSRDEVFLVSGDQPLEESFITEVLSDLAAQIAVRGGKIVNKRATSHVKYEGEFKHKGPDSMGGMMMFSVGGSKGVLVLRYTTGTGQELLGIVTCEIVAYP